MKLFLALFFCLSFLWCAGQEEINIVDDSVRIKKMNSMLKYCSPILGYRFVIIGDFDGDKKIDTLIERFTDSTFQFEAPKYFSSSKSNCSA